MEDVYSTTPRYERILYYCSGFVLFSLIIDKPGAFRYSFLLLDKKILNRMMNSSTAFVKLRNR